LSRKPDKRGGGGRGAGRRKSLTMLERIAIGSAAENLSKDHARENAYCRIRARVITDEIKERWAIAASIPIDERRAWLQSFEGQDHEEVIEFALLEVTRVGKLDEDPASALDEVDIAPRIFSEPIKTPYGKRPQILAIVSKCAARKLQKPVSARMVDKCWKLFRAEFQ